MKLLRVSASKHELEMLLIISEELQKQFEKKKSTVSPENFCTIKTGLNFLLTQYGNTAE